MFFRSLILRPKKSLNLEQINVLSRLAEIVVLALEQTAKTSGSEKKRLALHMLADLVQAHGLDPPQLLLDAVIEAAIKLTK